MLLQKQLFNAQAFNKKACLRVCKQAFLLKNQRLIVI